MLLFLVLFCPPKSIILINSFLHVPISSCLLIIISFNTPRVGFFLLIFVDIFGRHLFNFK